MFDPLQADRILEFQAKHEPQKAKLVPPHLRFVFGLKSLYRPVIVALANAVSRHTRALLISFDYHTIEFDPFEQKYKVFLL